MGTIGAAARMGYDSVIAIGEEAALGTRAATASMVHFEFRENTVKSDITKEMLDSINGGRDFTKHVETEEVVEGTVGGDLNVAETAIMYIVKQAMGGTVTSISTGVGGFVTHTFNPGDMENNDSSVSASAMKGLSIYKQPGATKSSGMIFTGNRVNNLTISGEIGQPIKFSAAVVGVKGSVSADTYVVSFADQKPLMFSGVKVGQADSIGGTIVNEVFQSFSFTLANNLEADENSRQLGQKTLGVLPAGKRGLGLSLTQRHDTTTAYDRFYNNTINAVQIFMDSGQTVGSAAGNTTYSMRIDLPTCYFGMSGEPEVSDNGLVMHEVDVKGLKSNTTSTYSVQMLMVNGIAGV